MNINEVYDFAEAGYDAVVSSEVYREIKGKFITRGLEAGPSQIDAVTFVPLVSLLVPWEGNPEIIRQQYTERIKSILPKGVDFEVRISRSPAI